VLRFLGVIDDSVSVSYANQDTIMTPGLYYVQGNNTATALEDDGILIVVRYSKSPGVYIDRVKIGINGGHIAVKHATSGTWKQII
jgi:hypothetical protein